MQWLLCLAFLGVQLVQQIIVSREAETAKVCTRAYMVTANEKSYMLTFSSLKGEFTITVIQFKFIMLGIVISTIC